MWFLWEGAQEQGSEGEGRQPVWTRLGPDNYHLNPVGCRRASGFFVSGLGQLSKGAAELVGEGGTQNLAGDKGCGCRVKM